MKTAITPIKTIQTIAAARYLNISNVMTEKTVHLYVERKSERENINNFEHMSFIFEANKYQMKLGTCKEFPSKSHTDLRQPPG